jgi:pimeloyl-ACP methyl ester carboxylesterase
MATLRLIFPLLFIVSCASAQPKNIVGKEKVILVHGYGRKPSTMSDIAQYLEERGYQPYMIGYSSYKRDIDGIEQEFQKQMDKVLVGVTDRVHFVGHSMGGLVVRNYLSKNKIPNLGNVVLLGTPNSGTPVVDHYKDSWWFWYAGPAAPKLSSKGSDFLRSLPVPSYKLGIIAGLVSYNQTKEIFSEPNDGVVTCESSKVTGMADFVALPINHHYLKHDSKSLEQVFNFLKHEKFSEGLNECPHSSFVVDKSGAN